MIFNLPNVKRKPNFAFSKYLFFAILGHYKPGVSLGSSIRYAEGDSVLRYEDRRKERHPFSVNSNLHILVTSYLFHWFLA